MLFRRLRNLDARDYVMMSRTPLSTDARSTSTIGQAAKRYQLSAPPAFANAGRHLVSLLAPLYAIRRAVEIARIVRREKCGAILACSGDVHDLPAAYLASRLVGVPFHAYLFDDYVFQWPPSIDRSFARRVAPFLLRGAKSVIVPNESLRDELSRRYGVRAVIVRNSYEPLSTGAVNAHRPPASSHRRRIVYTGTVYHAHFDAFRNLIAGIRSLPGEGEGAVHVDIYTSDPPERLEAQGIGGGTVTIHNQRTFEEIQAIQMAADILFLPLAFETSIPELIRTSAPGKMGEYLASGRPVLVHAPRDSFVAWYFREHDCGVVVDELSPDKMTDALRQLTENSARTAQMVKNARTRADLDFQSRDADLAFVAALEGARA
jgi:glycosyltransferase involved in cell wall biosynthesis